MKRILFRDSNKGSCGLEPIQHVFVSKFDTAAVVERAKSEQWFASQLCDTEQLNVHNRAQLFSNMRCVVDCSCHSATTWHTCLLGGLCRASEDTLEDGLGGGQ